MKHKHYDLIVVWANGAKIQYKSTITGNWTDVVGSPGWYEHDEYRIKPQPKHDIVTEKHIKLGEYEELYVYTDDRLKPNTRFTFDGETRQLKKVELI